MKKKIFFILIIFVSVVTKAQYLCGFDGNNEDLAKERAERTHKVSSHDFKNAINNVFYTKGNLYKIPLIIHVIESASSTSPTDKQIQDWIENANKMFATTYGNNFPTEQNGGTVIPFRFEFAKRNPKCNLTTGIIRYNGDNIEGYKEEGLKYRNNSKGVNESEILAMAPHWNEREYMNVYIVTKINGAGGYAADPQAEDEDYDLFINAGAVTQKGNTALVHELGHMLGLLHTFQGGNFSNCPSKETSNDCSEKGDKVCDTEPIKIMRNAPKNSEVNPCTGSKYSNTQFNIMGYTVQRNMFTSGQRQRMLDRFISSSWNREDLTRSPALIHPANSGSVISTTCNIKGVKNSGANYYGIKRVRLAKINNFSANASNGKFYEDFTELSCDGKVTAIPSSASSKLEVHIDKYDQASNQQYIKAWIDYNDNGTFENSEVIAEGSTKVNIYYNAFNFTPPANAVKDKYLRMRVASDFGVTNISPCGELNYGQAEDYKIKIESTLQTKDSMREHTRVVYDELTETLNIIDRKNKFNKYEIFDISGRSVLKGKIQNNLIKVNLLSVNLLYIIKLEGKGKFTTIKFLR